MIARHKVLPALALGLALTFAGVTAQASHVPGPLLSGRVTAVSSEWLAIDGKRLRVRAGSPASEVLRHLHVGQDVSVGLDGAPDSSASQVVVIQTPGQRR